MFARLDPRLAAALALGLGLLEGRPAAGSDFTAVTLLATRPYARDGVSHNDVPLYEQLSLMTPASSYGFLSDVRFVARAWGRESLGDPQVGARGQGDIDVAYLEATALDHRLLFRAGRQLLSEGAARATQIDGLSATGQIWRGLGIDVYGGAPVVARFGSGGIGNKGDAIAGTRIFWRQSFDAQIGISYLYAVDGGQLARSDAAIDGWWQPIRTVTLGATAQWSLAEARLAEGRLMAQWQPTQIVQLTIEGMRTAPDLFLARDSIFAVFSQERRDQLGGEVALRLGPRLSAYLDWHETWLEGGHGRRAGGKATWHAGQHKETTLGMELRLTEEPDNGFKQARVFWMRTWQSGVRATLDADAYWLEKSINGQARSLTVSATAGYPITAAWDGMVGGSYGTTPYLDRRFELIARAVYRFDFGGRKP